ncbi:NACHT, LRR and PYD domains-containing protein 12-like [Lepisosteus oculatus]|uniref:NACHT, LRR and PYD domains-containing protein 12-like n=1 Tax=Lepisosteus oculatus TaxID=7918 RepID=UPI0035F50D82
MAGIRETAQDVLLKHLYDLGEKELKRFCCKLSEVEHADDLHLRGAGREPGCGHPEGHQLLPGGHTAAEQLGRASRRMQEGERRVRVEIQGGYKDEVRMGPGQRRQRPGLQQLQEALHGPAHPEERGGGRRGKRLVRQNTLDNECASLGSLLVPGKPQILVLLGIAGIGKTYTVRKIMLDWASGELYNQFDYVFHLDCKSLCNVLEESTVLDLIFESCPELRQVPGEVIGSTERVLVLIDGLDAVDLPPDSGPWKDGLGTARLPVPRLLLGLLKRRLCSHWSLLVTVRPTVVEQIMTCNLACQWAEILGFPKERIDDYFQRYFEEPETAAEAVQHVRSNEVLLEMCVTPLICWVVCVLLDSEERPRDSMTYILVNYIYTLLKHHHTDSVSDKEMLQKLCLLARTGVEQRKSCFRMQELPVELAGMPKLPDSFVMRILTQQGVTKRSEYSFTLPALQEVLAAIGFAGNAAGDQLDELLSNALLPENGHLRVVVQHLHGLLHEESWDLLESFGLHLGSRLRARLARWTGEALKVCRCRPEDSYFLLDLMLCLFERREEAFARDALRQLPEITLQCIVLEGRHFLVLRYCLQHCRPKLVLRNCSLRSQEARKLLPLVDRCESFSIQMSEISEASMRELSGCFAKMHQLGYLELTSSPNSDALDLTCSTESAAGDTTLLPSVRIEGVPRAQTCLRWFLQDCGFCPRTLYFHDQKEEEEVQGMLEVLQETDCQLQCVSVKRCCLSERSVRALLALLESRPAITTLDLEGSGLGEAGLRLLCDRLGDMGGGGLQSLGLMDTGLTAASVPAVCSLLRKTAVSALSLGDNPLGDEGVRLLCEALGDPSCQLQRLSLVRCALSDGALPNLQVALEGTRTLTELRLGGNDWPESCAEALRRLWMSCRGLKYLEGPECGAWRVPIQSSGVDTEAGQLCWMVYRLWCRGIRAGQLWLRSRVHSWAGCSLGLLGTLPAV